MTNLVRNTPFFSETRFDVLRNANTTTSGIDPVIRLDRTAHSGFPAVTSLLALELFCCAGGAGMGLHQAGFSVVGVDIVDHPNYPFEFRQGDALDADLSGFDFVWASPPCQAHTTLKHRTGKDYECFITRTREKLKAWGGPYIIENVMGSPLENPVMLCGSSFGLGVRRHRLFESNFFLYPADCRHDLQPEPLDVTGTGSRRKGERMDGKGGTSRKPRNLEEARDAMGMPWANRREISQAIPPAYSRFLGEQVARILKANSNIITFPQ